MAGYVNLSVHIDRGTRALANKLAKLQSKRLGHRVSRPDAVHAALEAAVEEEKRMAKDGAK